MSHRNEIRSYDYVNHPYAHVRDAMSEDPTRIFSAATRAASSRARSVASELRVSVGGLEVSAEVEVSVETIEHRSVDSPSGPETRIPIHWKATNRPGLFPLMDADLLLYPLTPTETQLEFLGRYQPPLGVLGGAIDAVAGHRIAEASVHRFVSDVAAHLRKTLG
jgi:hypothetical protein